MARDLIDTQIASALDLIAKDLGDDQRAAAARAARASFPPIGDVAPEAVFAAVQGSVDAIREALAPADEE